MPRMREFGLGVSYLLRGWGFSLFDINICFFCKKRYKKVQKRKNHPLSRLFQLKRDDFFSPTPPFPDGNGR
jgi:hypothetical protein